jgi:hypothetical protein
MAVPPSLQPVPQVLRGQGEATSPSRPHARRMLIKVKEKLDDLNRLLDILELDLTEKNLLPPSKSACQRE